MNVHPDSAAVTDILIQHLVMKAYVVVEVVLRAFLISALDGG